MIDLEEELEGVALQDAVSSPPAALRRDVKRPDYWAHPADCACCRCRDLSLAALDIKYFTLQVHVPVCLNH